MKKNSIKCLSVLLVAVMAIGVASGAFAKSSFDLDGNRVLTVVYDDVDLLPALQGGYTLGKDLTGLNVSGPLSTDAWRFIAILLGNGYLVTKPSPTPVVNVTTTIAIPPVLISGWDEYWDELARQTKAQEYKLNVTLSGIAGKSAEDSSDLAETLGKADVQLNNLTLKGSSLALPESLDVNEKIILKGSSSLDLSAIPLDVLRSAGASGKIDASGASSNSVITLPSGLNASEAAAIMENLADGDIPDVKVKSGNKTWNKAALDATRGRSSSSGCNTGPGGLFGLLALAGTVLIRGKRG